jgi:squalene cyclase
LISSHLLLLLESYFLPRSNKIKNKIKTHHVHMIKMPTAQSTSTTTAKTHKTKEQNKHGVDDKIAKAAAKVESSQQQQQQQQEAASKKTAAAATASATNASNSSGRNTPSGNQQEQSSQQQQQQAGGGGNKTPLEQPEFIKQSLIVIEKKVRNLDKRRVRRRFF